MRGYWFGLALVWATLAGVSIWDHADGQRIIAQLTLAIMCLENVVRP